MPPKLGTRERIVRAAARLFHEQGYHATGVATILREAEVNSGSLYHFFASKEALLEGVLEWYLEHRYEEVIGPAERAARDPIERVFALLANYRVFLEVTHCGMGCPIGNLALELGGAYPRVRELIDANFRGWISDVKRWLDAAADRLPPDTDRAALAELVLTIMEGGIMQARAAGTIAPFDRAVRQLRHYFDCMLAARHAPQAEAPATEGSARTR